jgi:hypothetical protein
MEIERALDWYKNLSIEQKIQLKELSELISGIKWEDFTIIFTPRERLEILFTKLLDEGIIDKKQVK